MGSIFISHSSRDNAQAGEMRDWLRGRDLDAVFLDFDPEDGIPAGRAWEQELYRQLGRSHAVIVLCSPHSMASRWCFAEITQARALGKQLLPVKIEPCELPAFLKDTQAIDMTDPARREEAYGRLWDGLRRAGLERSFRWDDTRPPYPGLPAFDEQDAAVFFGRDDEIRACLDALDRVRQFARRGLVLVLGASGSGKSSIVRAGVVPRLRQDADAWLVIDPVRRRLGPFAELATALSAAYARGGESRAPQAITDRLIAAADAEPADGKVLHQIASELTSGARHQDAAMAIVIDQFEEYLVQEPAEPQNHRFLALLRAALECDTGPLVVLATLRSDYLGDLQIHPVLGDLPFSEEMIGPLPLSRYRTVIEGPAEVAGIPVERGLADLLVEHTATDDALPLLAFTLRELWERSGEPRELALAAYRELGGLEGSVRRAAEGVTAGLRLTVEREEALRRAFLAMTRITEDGKYARQPMRWEDLPPGSAALLQPFVEARLLVSGNEAGTVEVAHEALFRAWPRLTAWLDDDRRFLMWRRTIEERAQAWVETEPGDASGRDESALLRGGELATAETFLETYAADLDEDIRAYIEAARDLQERERAARARLRQRIMRGLVAFSAVVLVFLALALWQWRIAGVERGNAREAQATAETQADASRAQALSAQARALADERLDMALLLALEAIQITDTSEARGSLLEVLQSQPRLQGYLRGHDAPVATLVFDARSGTLISGDEAGAIVLWDVDSGAQRAVLEGNEGGIYELQLSPEGNVLASAGCADWDANGLCDRGEILLWDVETGERIAQLVGHSGVIGTLAFDPDGSRLYSFGSDPGLAEWDIGSRPIPEQPVTENADVAIDDWVVSPDGSTIAVVRFNDTLLLLDSESGEARELDERESASPLHWPSSVAFSADGTRIVVGYYDGTVGVRDVESGRETATMSGDVPSVVFDIAVSHDGTTAAALHSGGAVEVWDVESQTHRGDLITEHVGGAQNIEFGADDRTLFTAGADGVIARWDLGATHRMGDVLVRSPLYIWDAAFSPDGTKIATLAPRLQVWDVETRRPVDMEFSGPSGLAGVSFVPNCLAFSPDGTTLAARSGDGTIAFWDVATGRLHDRQVTVDGSAEVGCMMTFSPDGGTLATALFLSEAVDVVDVESGRRRGEPLKVNLVTSLLFRPGSAELLTIHSSGAPLVWDLEADTPAGEPLRGHQDQVVGGAFSGDGATLVTIGADGEIMAWDLTRGYERPRLFASHGGRLSNAAIAPDGSVLATGDGSGNIVLWDVVTGQQLGQPMVGGAGYVDGVMFNATGTVLASWTIGGGLASGSVTDSSVMLWDVGIESWKERACEIAGRNLTEEELGEPPRTVCVPATPDAAAATP